MMFDIGYLIRYRKYRGEVTEVTPPNGNKAGYYKIRLHETDKDFVDYHYVFQLDLEKIREIKINNILND